MTDIFISYSRDDDAPPPDKPGRKGFVTFLDDAIRYEFQELGPDRPSTWRDTRRISPADQFTPEIEEALKTASFLLVVLSPNWMASKWCRRELETFARHHGPDGLRERIVVVGKRHIDPDKRPSLLQGQVGFRFYVRNEDPEDIAGDLEFFDRGEPRDERYWEGLKALAAHLVKRRPRPTLSPIYAPSGRTIFVAKPASDMRRGYDRIVSELTGKGHRILPDPKDDIPLDRSVNAIDEALADAEIAIHLLGEKAGEAPEDELPMVKLQLSRSAAKTSQAAPGTFHRVIWAPSIWTTSLNANQLQAEKRRHPLEVLARFDQQLATDKVEGDSLSKFVDFVNQHLLLIVPPRSITLLPSDARDVRLFLYHSQEDSKYALALAQALQQRKLEAMLPALEGPEADLKSFNSKQLVECDGVIVCWASASEVWVRAQASALRNWSALGRSRQFSYRAVVAAPPPGERKQAGKLLFPPSEIDIVVDISDKEIPTADLLDVLVPAAGARTL
uniref:Toll/interleukin-1 receptor domain-containing protein n=1 Tax=Bradyrhizobium quebecense TaxID=2748629 RepID=A0A974AAP1_9BRAD